MLLFLSILCFASINGVLSQNSSANSTANRNNSCTFSLVVRVDKSDNKTRANFTQLFDVVSNYSTSYSVVADTFVEANSSQVYTVALKEENEKINFTATKIDSPLTLVSTKINSSDNVSESGFSNLMSAQTKNGFALLLIDLCPKANASNIFKSLNATNTGYRFYGFYIDLRNDSANNCRIDFCNNSTSNNSASNTFSAITRNLTENQAYFLKFENKSSIWNLTRSLCSKENENQEPKNDNKNVTLPECCCNETSVQLCNNTMIKGVNCSEICHNATINNGTTAPNVATTTMTATTPNITTTPSANNSITIEAIPAGHGGTTLALGIVIVLLVVGILCVLFRKKILHCVATRMRSPHEADNELTAIRYGTLRNKDEFDSRAGW